MDDSGRSCIGELIMLARLHDYSIYRIEYTS